MLLCIYGYAEDMLMGDVQRQSGKYRRCAQSLHITNNNGHQCCLRSAVKKQVENRVRFKLPVIL